MQLAYDFANGSGDQETASRLDELACQVGEGGVSQSVLSQAEANRTQLEELEDRVGLAEDADVKLDPETIGKLYTLHAEQVTPSLSTS